MGIGVQALVIFIDYSKAFDNISHVQLFDIMLQLGFPEHIGALLQSLYIDQTAVIRWNGFTTETFPIGKGVRQGCILSTHLFSLYTESVMREAKIQYLGYSIGGRNISNARYAGETALIAVTNGDAATTRQIQRRRCANASQTKCQKDQTHDHRRCAR